MYIIAPQFIREYILRNFSNTGKMLGDSSEFTLPSLFVPDDYKKHLSINLDTGLWQCFKTGRGGNFVRFYAEVEGLSYFAAQREIIIKNFEYLGVEPPEKQEEKKKELELDTSELIPLFYGQITDDSLDGKILKAWNFLYQRGLFKKQEPEAVDFYLCTKGKFADRIIIPYVSSGAVYYFQARTIVGSPQKYLNPSSDIAPKKSDVLFPYKEEGPNCGKLVVCEGPLDAISLQRQGVNATSVQGSVVSDRQAEILSTFKGKIILGFDNDKAGFRGIEKFEQTRRRLRMKPFDICPPPPAYDDWNTSHMQGSIRLDEYINRKSVPYDYEYKMMSSLYSDNFWINII